jgi:hypothetical protein
VKNGSGKTTYLNHKYENQPNECTKIFFSTASELSPLLNDKQQVIIMVLMLQIKNQHT